MLSLARAERHVCRAPLDAGQIMAMIPHRPPFLFLDRVVELDPPARAVGLKNVTIAEPWSGGHFPQAAILPGVLVTECLAQLAGVLIAAEEAATPGAGPADGIGVLAEIKQFRFRRRIVPGDQLRLEVELNRKIGRVREFACLASVAAQRAAHGALVIVG
jgi:3-hydroxyacyl-[acyl-carrier-protein] dehydratase